MRSSSLLYFGSVVIESGGAIRFRITSDQTESIIVGGADDLSLEFEENGSLEIIVGSDSLLVALAGAATTEPYIWTPTNSAEAIAFRALLSEVDGAESGQLIIRDFVPTTTVDHAVDAGGVSFAFALPEPTVTHTAAPTAQLVLSDSDDTGLEVVAKALLAASAAATVAGNIFWADADRGGTDTPLDGELGLGANNTVISRFRRVSATVLVLNDNDNPSSFDIGAYFNTGGGGNDLTLYFQTLSGEVSFSVATQLVNQGGAFAQFTLPADGADVARWNCER